MLLPGAGHFFLGERARAGLIASGILGLMVCGLLIGGIDAIDSKEDTIWFAGQALIGPIPLAIDYYHQTRLKVLYTPSGMERSPRGVPFKGQPRVWLRSPDPGEVRDPASGYVAAKDPDRYRAAYSKSLGRMNELGTLYITIAGMLNLIVIIDAFYFARARRDALGGGGGAR
jgi:hypothetical protein